MQENSNIIKRIKITGIVNETAEAKTFMVEALDGWYPVYKPGQFITLVFYTKHGEKRRSYSISSAGLLGEHLSFTVKRVENGEFSRLLHGHAKIGDILFTSGISGLFLLPENLNQAKQYFFIAAGSGITPCFPMIKTLLAHSKADIVLVYSNKTEEDCIFRDQLLGLSDTSGGRLKIKFLYSNLLDIYRSRLSKWLLEQLLQDYLQVPPGDCLFYVCGPFEYMRTVHITLLEKVPAKNIFKENFFLLPRLLIPRPPDLDAHKVTIHINNIVYEIIVQYPQTILSAAKSLKITLPYSCEAGRCGSCVATCTRGKIWMAYNEVLLDEEIEKGRVLVCQGYPVGTDAEIVFS